LDPGDFLFYEDMDLCLGAGAGGVPTLSDRSLRERHRALRHPARSDPSRSRPVREAVA
jgi:hypothetical protein